MTFQSKVPITGLSVGVVAEDSVTESIVRSLNAHASRAELQMLISQVAYHMKHPSPKSSQSPH